MNKIEVNAGKSSRRNMENVFCRRMLSEENGDSNRVARFLSVQHTKTEKIYKITTKCFKWLKNKTIWP
jgi:hypothetical protein